MAVSLETTIKRFIGLSTDVKPTGALVPVGSTYFEYDTKCVYITYDGTNYTLLDLDYGLVFGGTCNAAMIASTTTVACADLAGYGNDYFNQKFYIQVIKNTNSIGAAPDGEIRQITDYVDATGTFTTDAFSANVEASDEIYILHSSIMIILSDLPSVGEWVLGDYDNFDVADADGDNDRWDIGYISGAAGGSADIDTTANDKYTVLAGYNIAGAERYSGYKAIPFYADYMKVTTDLDCTFGATDSATPKAVGIALSKGVAWDANNYIVIERQVGTGVDRIQMRSSLNGGAEVTTNVAITDDSIALKIERLDETYAGYYSTVQSGSGVEDWIKIGEIEDPNNYMTNQYTYYMHAFNGAAGDATETAQGDFGLFKFWLGTGGGAQYIVGDYDSSWVTSDIDGNVFERQEALQKAVNVTDAGVLTGFEEDGTGANLFNTLVAVQGISDSAGNTTTLNDTGRTEANDYWIGSWLVLIDGDNAGMSRPITDSVLNTSVIVSPAFPNAIGDTTQYIILKRNKVPTPGVDGTLDYWTEDVVGSKTDTADYTFDATTSSIVRLLKGVLGSRVIEEGTFTTSGDTVPADTVIGAYADDYFNGQILIPLTGDVAFQPRLITDFANTTGVFTIDADHPFTSVTGEVAYIIVANDGQLIPGTDSANDQTAAQAIGAKADTADYTRAATTSSLQRLIKGVLGSRVVYEGTLTADSTTVPADTTAGAAYGNDYFNGQLLITLTGAAAFQPRLITNFTTASGIYTLDADHPFTVAPGTVAYIIVANEGGLISAIDGATNTTTAHVIGNKSDTAGIGATDSAMRILRAQLTALGIVAAGGTGFEIDGTGHNLFETIVAIDSVTDGVGTTATFVDSARTEGADYWNGNLIVSLTGGAAGQIRTIVDDDGAGTLTVEPLLIAAPGTAIAYVILKQKNADWIVGANSADNAFDSSAVVANSNGSVLERLEHLLAAIGGTTGTTTALGLATTAIDTGRTEAADYWNGGVFVQIDGANAGLARPIADFNAVTDTLTFEPGFPNAVASGVNYLILTRYDTARLIGADNADNAIDTSTVVANADGSLLERLEYLQTAIVSDFGGLFFAGSVSSVEGGSETTVFYATGLSGYGDDNFITNYYIQFVNTTDDLAPINEVRQITDYVSTTGQFTVAPAFSADVTTSDKFIVLHETLIINGRDDADNAFASTNVIANADGSIIEREQYIQTDVASLLADVGDASGSTLTSLLGIVGNPGVDSISTVGGQLATAAHAGVVDNATSLMGYIKQLVTSSGGGAGATGSFYEQADVAFTDNAIAGGETDVFDLNTADTRFVVRSLTLKSVNPGIDKVIVRLRKLVNDISTVVATFNIDSTNYTTYFNLMDMFGESPIAGDDLHVTIQTDANTYAVTGQYSFGKTNN